MKRPPTFPVPIPSSVYYGWIIVGVALAMNLAAAATNPVIFSFFIGPMSEDLGWSRSTLSWAVTFRIAAGGVLAPLLGAMVDRFGVRWLGTLAGLLAGGCLIGFAFVHQAWQLYLLAGLSGASGFGGPVIPNVAVAKWFELKRGRALAIATVGMPGGTIMGIFLAQWLIDYVGWRQAGITFGVLLCALAAPLCAWFMRRTPEEMGLNPDGAKETHNPAITLHGASQLGTSVDWTTRQALRSSTLWLIVLAMALSGVALTGTLVHRVAFWRESGMSPSLVAFGTAMDPFTMIFSVLAFGILGEQVRTRYLGLMGGAGLALSMLPMVFAMGNAYSILANNITWGIMAGTYITCMNLIWPNYFGRKSLGSISGITLPISVGASGLGPPLFGYLLDVGVTYTVLWTVSLVMLLAVGALLFLAKPPSLKQSKISTAG
ncbi:MAG: MFS transporter [Dehalococcoidia bacterium]|nr:MFS transporter [Dehalococcoidia bacterium]